MTKFTKGTCENFCPEQECRLRIKERLLHFYELKNGQKNVPGTLVKCFSRSAAGVKLARSKDLRSERCLIATINYLLRDIILDKRKPYNVAYDFIFDRLRAVRQEMIIQNFNAQQTCKLLEPIIMFLAYSYYRLCDEPIDNFDPKICATHLQECLKRVLCSYDELDMQKMKSSEIKKRFLIESIYQIFNLGETEALNRCVILPLEFRNSEPFVTVYKMAMSYNQCHIYRAIQCSLKLPHILCAVASLKLPILRRKLYQILASGYNSKQLTVPIEFVRNLTIHDTVADVVKDCNHYNLKLTIDGKFVHFNKNDFQTNADLLPLKRSIFIEMKLECIDLPDMLLLKNY